MSERPPACPYDEDWEAMPPEPGGRRCARCDRHIFDYSLLTEAQTVQLKVLSGGSVCRKVHLDAGGAPIFAKRATRRIVRTAAGVVLSVALAGCEPDPAPSPPEPPRVEHAEPEAPPSEAPGAMAPLQPRDEAQERAEAERARMEAERAAAAAEEAEEAERRAIEAAAEAERRRERRRARRHPNRDLEPLVGLDGL